MRFHARIYFYRIQWTKMIDKCFLHRQTVDLLLLVHSVIFFLVAGCLAQAAHSYCVCVFFRVVINTFIRIWPYLYDNNLSVFFPVRFVYFVHLEFLCIFLIQFRFFALAALPAPCHLLRFFSRSNFWLVHTYTCTHAYNVLGDMCQLN